MLAPSPVPVDRRAPLLLAAGAVCGCALVALVDPNEGGRYPSCPTQAILGLDCPACGTLRGLHALSRGQLGRALDHNLLLAAAVPIGLLVWVAWVAAAVGRPVRVPQPPRWLVTATITVAVVFAVTRNLPVDALGWLASDA